MALIRNCRNCNFMVFYAEEKKYQKIISVLIQFCCSRNPDSIKYISKLNCFNCFHSQKMTFTIIKLAELHCSINWSTIV